MKNTCKQRVMGLLKNASLGLTINGLTKGLSASCHTISLVLAELKGTKKIEIRNAGMAKLRLFLMPHCLRWLGCFSSTRHHKNGYRTCEETKFPVC